MLERRREELASWSAKTEAEEAGVTWPLEADDPAEERSHAEARLADPPAFDPDRLACNPDESAGLAGEGDGAQA